MSYQTYTTEALVCGTWSRNTADKSYLLFTREAGMLYANARSVREEKSKQRYALQEFSHVKISLVKGKSGWRVGSVESLGNVYSAAFDKAARGSITTVYRSLRRFYKGEEAIPELFDYLRSALSVLSGEVENRLYAERLVLLRMLFELGYVDKKQLPEIVLLELSEATFKEASIYEKKIEKLIQQATDSSQL